MNSAQMSGKGMTLNENPYLTHLVSMELGYRTARLGKFLGKSFMANEGERRLVSSSFLFPVTDSNESLLSRLWNSIQPNLWSGSFGSYNVISTKHTVSAFPNLQGLMGGGLGGGAAMGMGPSMNPMMGPSAMPGMAGTRPMGPTPPRDDPVEAIPPGMPGGPPDDGWSDSSVILAAVLGGSAFIGLLTGCVMFRKRGRVGDGESDSDADSGEEEESDDD